MPEGAPQPLTPPTADDAAGIARLMAPMLGIPLAADWLAPVVQNLLANARAAQLLADFPLDDELEPSAVFRR